MGNEPRLLIRPCEVLSRIAEVAVLEVAHSSAFAGERDKVVVPAILTTRPCKAVGKDAALLVLGKRLAQIGLGGAGFGFGWHEYCANEQYSETIDRVCKAQSPNRCQFGLQFFGC